MRKMIFSLIVSLLALQGAQAQSGFEEDANFWDRVFVGGNFSLQFGNFTAVDVSPLVGYQFTQRLSGGVGVTYQYLSGDFIDGFGRRISYNTNIYGGRLFARYSITETIYAHTEYESLNLEFPNSSFDGLTREWVPAYFIGGGFFQPIGRNAGFNILALYNTLHDDLRSPYASPLVLRVGITAGF
ncbi:MAG: hypothetical protein AAFX87_09465 [Bacteroidota bacterium]